MIASDGNRFTITPDGPYSLAATADFLGGFTPASRAGVREDGHLHVAVCVDGSFTAGGFCLRQEGDLVAGEAYGDAPVLAVAEQAARIISADVDGRGFVEVGRRDPVVARLGERFRWLRPPNFWSPYEAAVWAVLSQRITMRQAAAIKSAMAEQLGPVVDIHGDLQHAFPPPARLLEVATWKGVPDKKIPWLHGIARAALEGKLDAEYLRTGDEEERLAELRTIPGIGPMSAEHILIRGAGAPDRVTPMEPRLPRSIALAYGMDHVPADDEVFQMAEKWRPYRTWVMVLLRLAFARDDPGGNARRR